MPPCQRMQGTLVTSAHSQREAAPPAQCCCFDFAGQRQQLLAQREDLPTCCPVTCLCTQGAREHPGHRHLPCKGPGRAGGRVGGACSVCSRRPGCQPQLAAQRWGGGAAGTDTGGGPRQRQVRRGAAAGCMPHDAACNCCGWAAGVCVTTLGGHLPPDASLCLTLPHFASLLHCVVTVADPS